MKENFEELRKGYEEVQMVESSIENAYPEAYRLARKFHELYEEQAPFFGYITNPNSREFYPNSNNARLMAYVCYHIVKEEVATHTIKLLQAEIEMAEKIIQEERFSGVPFAMNKLITHLQEEIIKIKENI